MRERRATIYYCDFCRKSTRQRTAMMRHEAGCTLNPNRVCKMCVRAEFDQLPMGALIEAARQGLATLLKTAHHCPACTLAAIRQIRKAEPDQIVKTGKQDAFGVAEFDLIPGGAPDSLREFDYKKSIDAFWQDFRDSEQWEQDVQGEFYANCL